VNRSTTNGGGGEEGSVGAEIDSVDALSLERSTCKFDPPEDSVYDSVDHRKSDFRKLFPLKTRGIPQILL